MYYNFHVLRHRIGKYSWWRDSGAAPLEITQRTGHINDGTVKLLCVTRLLASFSYPQNRAYKRIWKKTYFTSYDQVPGLGPPVSPGEGVRPGHVTGRRGRPSPLSPRRGSGPGDRTENGNLKAGTSRLISATMNHFEWFFSNNYYWLYRKWSLIIAWHEYWSWERASPGFRESWRMCGTSLILGDVEDSWRLSEK